MSSIETRLILEILGRPAEHVVKTLQELIERMGKEKGVHITKHLIHEPVLVKDSKDLFTTFAEVEVTFDSLAAYMQIIFSVMPSNVEIISPERMTLSNEELSTLGTQVLNKLHFYESVVKRLVSEREILMNRLRASEGKSESNKQPEPTKKSSTKKAKKKSKAS